MKLWTNDRVAAALGLQAAATLTLEALSGRLQVTDGGVFARWLEDLPFARVASWETGLLVAGVFLWLGATANSIVRMVIFLVEKKIDLRVGEEQLKGGRVIGPLERWLIFSLVLAGNLGRGGVHHGGQEPGPVPRTGPQRQHQAGHRVPAGGQPRQLVAGARPAPARPVGEVTRR